jgi:hypothetical protein
MELIGNISRPHACWNRNNETFKRMYSEPDSVFSSLKIFLNMGMPPE